jgi:hypothetical protein
MGMHLLRTFCSRRIQSLRQRVTKMWLYSGPSCLDRSFSEELREVEINTLIHKVLDDGANLNPEAGPTPLREVVTRRLLATCIPGLVCLDLFR